MQDAIRNYVTIKTANATGLTVEQVRTIDTLQDLHIRMTEHQYHAARRGDPIHIHGCEFKVELDQRLNLPRVTYFDGDWNEHEVAVTKDGKLDRTL